MTDNIYKAPEAELIVNTADDAELASRINRLVASFIDGLTIAVVTLPAMYFTGGFDGLAQGAQPSLLYSLSIGLLGLVIFFLINWQFLSRAGQTVGKKVMKIKVVTLEGHLPKMSNHFFKRYAVYFIPGQVPILGPLFSLANILFIFGKQKRCLHDHVAGTKVVVA